MTATLVISVDLAECEAIIERGLTTFIEVGAALLRIRDERLYRETHGTFEDYCQGRFHMSRSYAHRHIEAAEVAAVLPIGNTPRNESVTRILAPLLDEPQRVEEVWAEVVERHGPKATADQTRDVVREFAGESPVEPPASRLAPMMSSASNEWGTPLDLFDALNQEFRFGVDVCATPELAKCERYYTPEQDGLAQKWTGTCWMNPPYGDQIGRWVEKAHQSSKGTATVVCLLPARVDTGWWWDHCLFGEIRFLRGRLKFGNAETGAPFPSAVVIFGRKPRVVWWEWR